MMDRTDMALDGRYHLKDGLGYWVSRLSRVMQRDLETRLAPFGVSRLMWCVLTTVGHDAIRAPSAIAEQIGVNRPTVSRLLKELEGRGLLVRERSDDDGRGQEVSLTPEGADLLNTITPHITANRQRYASKLSREELADFLATIETLLDAEEGDLGAL